MQWILTLSLSSLICLSVFPSLACRYICSNDTKLPGAFDACQNKEQLWQAVRKGLRPEKLPRFDSDCWELMNSCWEGDSQRRPLIGDIALRLRLIMKRIGSKPLLWKKRRKKPRASYKDVFYNNFPNDTFSLFYSTFSTVTTFTIFLLGFIIFLYLFCFEFVLSGCFYCIFVFPTRMTTDILMFIV